MKLRYRVSAWADVRTFVAQYENSFLSLYRDTGIWSEESMIDGAHAKANQLFSDIYDTVEQQLEKRVVLGRKKLSGNEHALHFCVGDRLIIVHFSEDNDTKTRWVESISIDRKLIIF